MEAPLLTGIFQHYVEHLEQERRAETTVYRNRMMLERFAQWATRAGIEPNALTPIDVDRYVNSVLRQGDADHVPQSSVTRDRHVVCLRAAFQWALDVDLWEGKNPCRRVRVDVRRRPQRFFSNAELRSILAACVTAREFLVTAMFIFTGLRVSELAHLRWEKKIGLDRQGEPVDLSWVDLPTGVLHVLGKGEKHRTVPLHGCLIPLVEQARATAAGPYVMGNLSGGTLFSSGVLGITDAPMRRVGLKDHGVGTHAYRRSFNETLRRNGRGYDLERRLIMGHSIHHDINASRYSAPNIEQLSQLIERAYADDPILPSIPTMLEQPRRRRTLQVSHYHHLGATHTTSWGGGLTNSMSVER